MAIQIFSSRPSNKDIKWQQEPFDELFENFINPDSFNLANNDVEREYPNDFMDLFEAQASSSGSDTIDTSPMPKMYAAFIAPLNDRDSWRAALSFVADNAASPAAVLEKSSRQRPFYSQACGRSAASENNLLKLHRPGTPIPPLELSQSTSAPSWSIKDSKSFATPLAVRKKPQEPHSGVQKPKRRESASPMMMSSPSYKLSPQQESWARQLQSTANSDHIHFKTPFANCVPASPPSSTQLESDDLDYDFDQPIRSPSGFGEDIEILSPLSSNEFGFFQPRNTPSVSSSPFSNGLASSKSAFQGPQPSHLSSYSSTPYPLCAEQESFLMTPPLTQPMENPQWTHGLLVSSPPFNSSDKAEHWWDPHMQHTDRSEVTCGAPAAPDLLGLGISGTNGADIASTASNGNGILQPSAVLRGAATGIAPPPTPSHLSTQRTPFSASASPNPAATASIYPLSPLQSHAHVGQSQHMQQQPNMFRHRERNHTMASTMSISPPVNAQLAQLNGRTPSASPPPSAKLSSHRRTKSSHHTRRKSGVSLPTNGNGSRLPSVGFVNFTPDDSRKILTGVAPSGSSKTKARREKEAADKRRKFSEAAKKAVLEAGGDLGMLEREGLLVMESAL